MKFHENPFREGGQTVMKNFKGTSRNFAKAP